eukprot:1326260-Amorphochlora_amoeboformis.AAC.1
MESVFWVSSVFLNEDVSSTLPEMDAAFCGGRGEIHGHLSCRVKSYQAEIPADRGQTFARSLQAPHPCRRDVTVLLPYLAEITTTR